MINKRKPKAEIDLKIQKPDSKLGNLLSKVGYVVSKLSKPKAQEPESISPLEQVTTKVIELISTNIEGVDVN
jgi:hypothetical protein